MRATISVYHALEGTMQTSHWHSAQRSVKNVQVELRTAMSKLRWVYAAWSWQE